MSTDMPTEETPASFSVLSASLERGGTDADIGRSHTDLIADESMTMSSTIPG